MPWAAITLPRQPSKGRHGPRRARAESRIVLFGDEEKIRAILAAESCPADRFDIVATTEVIEMGDHPAKAFQQKSDSSIAVGFGYLAKGLIHGFASAGSTGRHDGRFDVCRQADRRG